MRCCDEPSLAATAKLGGRLLCVSVSGVKRQLPVALQWEPQATDQQEPKLEHCPTNRRLYQHHRSKADILEGLIDVRFTPKSGHWPGTVGCLVCAKSRHCSSINQVVSTDDQGRWDGQA
jgi:hypothetical protein